MYQDVLDNMTDDERTRAEEVQRTRELEHTQRLAFLQDQQRIDEEAAMSSEDILVTVVDSVTVPVIADATIVPIVENNHEIDEKTKESDCTITNDVDDDSSSIITTVITTNNELPETHHHHHQQQQQHEHEQQQTETSPSASHESVDATMLSDTDNIV